LDREDYSASLFAFGLDPNTFVCATILQVNHWWYLAFVNCIENIFEGGSKDVSFDQRDPLCEFGYKKENVHMKISKMERKNSRKKEN
jgi:hypothetical protein